MYIPLNLRPFDPNLSTFAAQSLEYTNLDDDLATIKGPKYFSKTLEDTSNIANSLKVDDLLYIHGSDGSEQLKIISVDPEIVVASSAPSIIIVASEIVTTVGGSGTEVFPFPGVLTTDTVVATMAFMNSMMLPLILFTATIATDGNVTLAFDKDPEVASLINVTVTR